MHRLPIGMRGLPAGLRLAGAVARLSLVLALAVLPVLAGGTALAAESANQGYARAERLAHDGKSKAAMQILATLVRQYPAHQPSRALYAHLLFTAGQQARAAKQYKVLGPEWATPDTAYEYGISLFLLKDCKRAEAGFAKVPASSSEVGLAHFYRGVCAMREHDYARAQQQLSQASGLPANLEAQKRQALQTMPAGGAAVSGAGPLPLPPATTPIYIPSVAADPLAMPGASSPEAIPGPYDPRLRPRPAVAEKSHWTNHISAGANATESTTVANYFGFKNAESDTTAYNVTADFDSKYAFAAAAVPGQPYLDFTVNAREKIASISGTATTYQYSASAPGTLFSSETLTPPGGIRFFGLNLGTEGRYPLPTVSSTSEAFAGYALSLALPDNAMDYANIFNKVYAGVRLPLHKFLINARLIYQSVYLNHNPAAGPVGFYDSFSYYGYKTFYFDPPQQVGGYFEGDNPRKNTFSGSVIVLDSAVERDWDTFAAHLHANYVSYQAGANYIVTGQETSHLFGDIGAVKKFPYGFSFLLTATYEELTGYNQFVVQGGGSAAAGGTKVQASATGIETKMRGELMYVPIDWIYLYGSYEQDSYTFTGVNPALLTAFEGVAPQLATTYGIQLGVRKTF